MSDFIIDEAEDPAVTIERQRERIDYLTEILFGLGFEAEELLEATAA